ncbi:methionine ABC transporter permease [Leadbettera azotonutricia]|uniref:D-methionine transport system permease protein MetI n=1 Tax=Leadbettera azotonutricia (strain ATCC BAA-888 / DSM 13862 / ZAS-9) TaxID=545695 RepID=F5Y9R5_LEAAZ|nr:methionine ABC transporter permease [Leadbettera azotonutricia]AEF83168.1 D-methionine transport system permease protein MetI [Leadbettera azotonutricia ZAS-9]
MDDFILKIIPNVIGKRAELLKSLIQTMQMLAITGSISFCIGIVLAFVIVVTRKGDILENIFIWTILDKVINFFRSIPFIILIALIIPVTRALVGTAIGVRGAIVPLVFGTIPFFIRQMENALSEIDRGAIEAALSMGTSPVGIIFRVYLKESVPGIIRGVTITLISMIGLIAMAGAVGGGGLGDFAIRYGYNRYQTDITIVTVLILIAIVTVIQTLGNIISKKMVH